MSLPDYVLIAIILLCTVLAVRSILRRRKTGGCCGDCSACGKHGCARRE